MRGSLARRCEDPVRCVLKSWDMLRNVNTCYRCAKICEELLRFLWICKLCEGRGGPMGPLPGNRGPQGSGCVQYRVRIKSGFNFCFSFNGTNEISFCSMAALIASALVLSSSNLFKPPK